MGGALCSLEKLFPGRQLLLWFICLCELVQSPWFCLAFNKYGVSGFSKLCAVMNISVWIYSLQSFTHFYLCWEPPQKHGRENGIWKSSWQAQNIPLWEGRGLKSVAKYLLLNFILLLSQFYINKHIAAELHCTLAHSARAFCHKIFRVVESWPLVLWQSKIWSAVAQCAIVTNDS